MELLKIIEIICETYNRLTSLWKSSDDGKFLFNQKNNTVKSIESNENVYNNAIHYREFISDNRKELNNIRLLPDVEFRVKALNSITSKINGYANSKKHEYGNVPVNKCLNDILGIRYITESRYSIDETKNIVAKIETKLKVTCINALREKCYRAIHIYFKLDNFSYPWELQIWHIDDVEKNLECHEKYKQSYTKVEKEYIKEGD